jgi:hypothetical protein
MSPTDLLAAYSEVAHKHDLPSMERAVVSVALRATLAPGPAQGGDEDAWTFLRGLAPREGWLQFQSHVVAFGSRELPEPADDWGLLLAAEAVLPDGGSLALRPDGRGALRATLIVPASREDPGDATIGVLADRVRHRATGRVPGGAKALNYIRYWQADPDRGLVPVLAAFEGFGTPEE